MTHLRERDAVARPADAAPAGIAGLSPAHLPDGRPVVEAPAAAWHVCAAHP